MPMLAKMADAMHEHGALAGIQLAYSGINGPNLYTKEVPLAPTSLPIRTFTNDPVSARAMDKEDIRNLRRWHRNAFLRAKDCGFDLVWPLWRSRVRRHPALPVDRHQPTVR